MREKSPTKENIYPEIVCTVPWRLTNVKALPNYQLEVSFIDGTHGFVDMSARIVSPRAGIFSALKDLELFNQVYIEYGAVTWPGEIDLAPDAMHEEIKQHGTSVLK